MLREQLGALKEAYRLSVADSELVQVLLFSLHPFLPSSALFPHFGLSSFPSPPPLLLYLPPVMILSPLIGPDDGSGAVTAGTPRSRSRK